MFHFTIMSLANNRISSTEGVEYPLLRKLNLNWNGQSLLAGALTSSRQLLSLYHFPSEPFHDPKFMIITGIIRV
ncbi:uncharacterized protein LOC143230570 isoform X5 [Tachypleus tridentatus]|uniref:uncharacterized protein LOC143230570 isoform X5 n=1 Tax=Tachypleus tridentatus TaxID=6853 RepID=UPI003FD4D612